MSCCCSSVLGAVSGSISGLLLYCFLDAREVAIFWQWAQHLQKASSVPLLPLSLDETSVSRVVPSPIGTVCRDGACRISVRKTPQRGSCTVVATLCPNLEIQRQLPQFILANKHLLTVSVRRQLEAEGVGSVRVLRQNSAWNSSETMLTILDALAASLRPYRAYCQPVLVMDTAPCHFTPKVLRRARVHRIKILMVPAGLTPWVQVCDVFAFRGYKAALERAYEQERVLHSTVTAYRWFRMLIASLSFFEHSWQRQFAAILALDGDPACLTTKLQALELSPTACTLRPSEEQLALVLPRGRRTAPLFPLLFGSRRVERAVRV
jgi:hypothetical protein